MKKSIATVIGLALAAGCDVGSDVDGRVYGDFVGVNGYSILGSATFVNQGGLITLIVSIVAGPSGMHGIHIHQNPACGNEGMDAGGHWDPDGVGMEGHGLPPNGGHYGDTGNITLDANGVGELEVSRAAWTMGDGSISDVNGRAMILHMNADDGSMPSSGGRIGCAEMFLQDL